MFALYDIFATCQSGQVWVSYPSLGDNNAVELVELIFTLALGDPKAQEAAKGIKS